MKTTHEEADTILVQQVAFVQPTCSMVIADDTDIFVMLMHFCFHKKIKNVYIASPVHGRAVLDINASVKEHKSILPNLLAAHGITGCDSVGTYHGIGKGAAHRVLKMKKYPLSHLGEKDIPLIDVYPQCTSFMLACYKQSSCTSLTDARVKMWSSKVSRSTASAPKLQSLPPTTEAFRENVAHAHLQVAIWKCALDLDPPDLNPTDFGWSKDIHTGSLTATTVPAGTPLAPQKLLKLIKCTCKGEIPCGTRRCSCRNAGIVCTMFCECHSDGQCWNSTMDDEDSEDDENN